MFEGKDLILSIISIAIGIIITITTKNNGHSIGTSIGLGFLGFIITLILGIMAFILKNKYENRLQDIENQKYSHSNYPIQSNINTHNDEYYSPYNYPIQTPST